MITPTHLPRTLFLALLAIVAPSAALMAQGTALVPPTDLVYDDLDRLAELGLLDSVIVGQRPYSRRELARISGLVDTALARRAGISPSRTDADASTRLPADLARRLRERFGPPSAGASGDGMVFAPLDGAGIALRSTDAERRPFPPALAGTIEAAIDPLADRRLGTPAVGGQSLALELQQRLEATDWLAFQARERLEGRLPRETGVSSTTAELLLASVRARYRNAALTVGRQQFAWAQERDAGLFLASDAPALDLISVSGDHPFSLPGVLSRLGPTQATIIYADLGASVARSHSRLVTYKVSVQPHPSLELGGTFLNHFGGAGGAPSSFGNRLIDFLPFIDIFRRHNYRDSLGTRDVDSDKVLGIDGRWRVRRLGDLLITGELLVDDFDVHRIPSLLTGYGSSTLGLTMPRLGSPDWALHLSAKHMGIITYTHFALTDGITTRGRVLGDELGPDSKAFAAELRWQPNGSVRAALEGRSAIYSQAIYYSAYTDADSVHFVVNKLSSGPDELRDRVRATLELQGGDGPAIVLRAAAERVRNAFFGSARQRHYALDVALRLGL